jgi:hypothetical protein
MKLSKLYPVYQSDPLESNLKSNIIFLTPPKLQQINFNQFSNFLFLTKQASKQATNQLTN